MLKKPIALQTFTVRDDLAKDFKGTVEQIAKIGYAGLEIGSDYGGMTAAEFRRFMDGLGLKAVAAHIGVDQLRGDVQSTIDTALELGYKYVVCPYYVGERAGDYYTLSKDLEKSGQKMKKAGLQLCYHNHAHEFTEFGGHYALDIILANAEDELLMSELDTYWAKAGGVEPQDYIRKYAGRVPLLHFKDMTAGPNPTFAEVGEGILDWPEICAAADEAGTEWYIVEQDTCQRPAIESAKISFDNLKNLGVV